jgi:hypothetical protein
MYRYLIFIVLLLNAAVFSQTKDAFDQGGGGNGGLFDASKFSIHHSLNGNIDGIEPAIPGPLCYHAHISIQPAFDAQFKFRLPALFELLTVSKLKSAQRGIHGIFQEHAHRRIAFVETHVESIFSAQCGQESSVRLFFGNVISFLLSINV